MEGIMDENTWRIIQIAMWMFGIQTTIILTVLGGMCHFFNKKFESVDQRFDKIDQDFKRIDQDFKEIRKDISSIDKEVAVITATLHFNGFDLDRHKAEGE